MQAVARVIRDEPADCIALKLGINTHNLASFSLRTFATSALGCVLTIRDGHPDIPIVLISPIFGAWREDIPTGANRKGEDGVPLSGATWPTLQTMRADIRSIVELLRKRGDRNIHYRDGLDLFGPGDVDYLPDGLHPNGDGYEILGTRFARYEIGPEGRLVAGRYAAESL